jgi:hypothetical protein
MAKGRPTMAKGRPTRSTTGHPDQYASNCCGTLEDSDTGNCLKGDPHLGSGATNMKEALYVRLNIVAKFS